MRLRHGPREAVENEAIARIGLVNPSGDNCDDQIIGDQLTAVHDALGAQSNRSAGVGRSAQHIPCRQLQQTMLGDETLSLRAFAGAGGAQQNQSHLRRPRSFERLIRPSY